MVHEHLNVLILKLSIITIIYNNNFHYTFYICNYVKI